MSMHKPVLAVAVLLCLAAGSAGAQTPGLGKPITEADITAWNIEVLPDGKGLPPGSGTAERGRDPYARQCASCHGASGKEGPADILVGGNGSLATARPLKTVGSFWPYATTLFDYTRRAMPPTKPLSLTSDEVYAVTAYLLFLNGIIPETLEMNATTLPQVRMPNRDGSGAAINPSTREQISSRFMRFCLWLVFRDSHGGNMTRNRRESRRLPKP